LVDNYLKNRFCQVKVEDSHSDPFPIRAGVPQGGLLSPILYSIYTVDAPVNLPDTTAAFYADDILLITSTHDPMLAEDSSKRALNAIEDCLKNWKIEANATESLCIVFSPRNKRFQPDGIYLWAKNTSSHRK